MKKDKNIKSIFSFIQFVVDVAVVSFSYFLTAYIRHAIGLTYSDRNISSLISFLPYVIFLFVLFFLVYKLYVIDTVTFYESFVNIFILSLILLIFGFAIPFFIRAFSLPRSLVLITFLLHVLLLTLSHLTFRSIYLDILPSSRVLVITPDRKSGESLLNYAKQYLLKVSDGVVFVANEFNIDNLDELVSVFDLFIVDTGCNVKDKANIIEKINEENKPIYVLPEITELFLLNQKSYVVSDIVLLTCDIDGISIADEIVKKIIDVVISIVALVIFSPVFLFASIAIIKEDGRPVFYLQNRVGKDGKIFKIIKFRTMVKDAEKYTGAVLSNGNDSRITKVGKFLRKTGLDEIPQFINVLKGEMSVVGPRPERPELISEIKKTVPNYDIRLKVKPGITGFAQLYGRYDTPFEQKLKMDILYMRSKSFLFTDIYIILNTLKLFFSPQKRA